VLLLGLPVGGALGGRCLAPKGEGCVLLGPSAIVLEGARDSEAVGEFQFRALSSGEPAALWSSCACNSYTFDRKLVEVGDEFAVTLRRKVPVDGSDGTSSIVVGVRGIEKGQAVSLTVRSDDSPFLVVSPDELVGSVGTQVGGARLVFLVDVNYESSRCTGRPESDLIARQAWGGAMHIEVEREARPRSHGWSGRLLLSFEPNSALMSSDGRITIECL
jgi:hypothetical protein